VLGVDRPPLADSIDVGAQLPPRGDVLFEHGVQERPIDPLLHQRQQGLERGFDVPAKPQVELRPPAQPLGPDVDLGDLGGRRHEALVGEVRAEQEQHVALVHRLVSSAPAEQPGHPHAVGVVMLDPLLAAEAVADGRLELLGQGHHLVVRAGAADAAEERYLLPPVEEVGQASQVVVRRPDHGGRGHGRLRDGLRGCLEGRDVSRQHDHRDAPLARRVLDGTLQRARRLAGVGDQLAVIAALAEELVGVGLLEVARADLRAGDVGRDRQDRGRAAVGVEQPVD
jgi:hypothetical protein